MNLRDFRRAGHFPTLLCAFLYFDVSFMVWVLLGALVNYVLRDIPMTETAKGFLVAVPILGGAVLRLALGVMTDRLGAKRTGLIGLALTAVPLLLGWLWADSYEQLLVVGVLLGVAGASFAAALPLASRWYPPQYQGLAMGIAGAGNSGTALAMFFGPRLAEVWGWHAVIGLALVPVLVTLVLFALFAKDAPGQPPPRPLRAYAAVLGQPDAWWFCLFYSVTFGGFVGLANFLSIFFFGQYEGQVSRVEAGTFVTLCVIAGSFLRPVGGYLADRFGGVRMLTGLYFGAGALMLALSPLPPLWGATLLLFLCMGLLGMGNGAVFQLVPQRFGKEIGVMTGVVGAAGGVGGFLLPTALGALKDMTGTFAPGFVLCGVVALGCVAALAYVSRSWEGTFVGQGGLATAAEVPGGVEPEKAGA